jgi:hypothetical protein
MSHIFISYSRKDVEIAERIINELAKSGFEPWVDWKSIPKGEELEIEIKQGIERADAFLFLISPDSVQSIWCDKEIGYALRNGKRILPIFLRETDIQQILPEIKNRNWVYCRDQKDDFNKAVEEIVTTLRTDYGWVKFHTELQLKALGWKQRKDNSRLLRGKELKEASRQVAQADNSLDPKPTSLQREYITASFRQKKLQNIGLAVIFIITLASIALAGAGGVNRFDLIPVTTKVNGRLFEIRNRSNYLFLSRDVGSTISDYTTKPLKLTSNGGYRMIVGTGPDGDRPGTVLAYDMRGNIRWEYTISDDPYNGPVANFGIKDIIVDQIMNNGEYQTLFVTQKTDWYPSELVLLNANGEPLGSYWNSGFIYQVLPQDLDGDNIKELVVSAVNNNLGYMVVNNETKHPVIVYALSPKDDFTGQTFPPIIDEHPYATEYNNWIAVLDPYMVPGIKLRIVQDADEKLIEVVLDSVGGYIHLDKMGRIRHVGLSDHWRNEQGDDKTPADLICFLKHDTDGWLFSARTDQYIPCPWYVSE